MIGHGLSRRAIIIAVRCVIMQRVQARADGSPTLRTVRVLCSTIGSGKESNGTGGAVLSGSRNLAEKNPVPVQES